jgi:hypothetical protein
LEVESHFFAQAGVDSAPSIYASYVAGMTGVHHHTQLFIGEDGVLRTFCLGWPQTLILRVAASK